MKIVHFYQVISYPSPYIFLSIEKEKIWFDINITTFDINVTTFKRHATSKNRFATDIASGMYVELCPLVTL